MRLLPVLSLLLAGVVYATPAANYLDLPVTNANGEEIGGVNPALPYDRLALEQSLTAARNTGVQPTRYQALLSQYWIVVACEGANISLKNWDPNRTAKQNRDVVFAVYNYYSKLYLEHPVELRWMAFANMAGSAFAAGMLDLDSLPGGNWYASMLMAMQKHIFMDIATMHVAYINGGIAAVRELRDAGLVDNETAAAWANPSQGVLQFSSREQNLVIARQFDKLRHHSTPLGEFITYGMTVAGPMPVPGAKTPTEYKKLGCGPFPAFNYADQTARWDFLSHDTVPAYLRLDPATVKSIVGSSFDQRVDKYRTAHRLVDIILTFFKDFSCKP